VHEKRRHERVPVSIHVTCEVKGGGTTSVTIVDLSVGGLYIQAESAPAFGSEVRLTGDFPGAPALTLPGVVRWGKPGGFGVQFGLLGARETHVLTAIVQKSRT
jgi:hypothetical protein